MAPRLLSFLSLPGKNLQKKINFFAIPTFIDSYRGILGCRCHPPIDKREDLKNFIDVTNDWWNSQREY